MTMTKTLPEKELVEKCTEILYREVGIADTLRFLSLHREKRLDSVKRHRKWQSTLDKKEFFQEIFRTEAVQLDDQDYE